MQGVVCVIGIDEFDTVLEPGDKLAELHPVAVQTRVCQTCGCQDSDAWIVDENTPRCSLCRAVQGAGPASCRQCGASSTECCVLSYVGCAGCRPEARLKGKVRRGPASGILARSALAFLALAATQQCVPSLEPAACAGPSVPESTAYHPVFHIVEEPGGIRHMTECEVPTEEYNSARAQDLAKRYPNLSPGILEHLEALEPFLDTSIVSGFSYGVNKADLVTQKGSLLGHKVSREGSSHEEERTQAINDFAPLKDVTQLRQFVGSTNWVRRYLLPSYATAVKILGEYMKPGAVFPKEGLGASNTSGCKAVKCKVTL